MVQARTWCRHAHVRARTCAQDSQTYACTCTHTGQARRHFTRKLLSSFHVQAVQEQAYALQALQEQAVARTQTRTGLKRAKERADKP